MPLKFTQDDLEVFSIPDFAKRMAGLKAKIRPKLEALGEELGPALMTAFKQEFFAHTAKHMRRTVNPPDETWVALGPESRGYKAYVYLAFCIGKAGAQARVVMKDESANRPMRRQRGWLSATPPTSRAWRTAPSTVRITAPRNSPRSRHSSPRPAGACRMSSPPSSTSASS